MTDSLIPVFFLRVGIFFSILRHTCHGLDETTWSAERCLLEHIEDHWCQDFPDGRFPLTVFGGSCECLVECRNNTVVAKRACWLSYVFNPLIQKCDYYANVSSDLYLFDSCPVLTIGHSPNCFNRTDGFYPDHLGRCNMYYQCANRNFFQWFRCGAGLVFNPLNSQCDSPRSVPRDRFPRCGEGPSCRGRRDGLFPDITGLCDKFYACRNQLFQSFYTCSAFGHVFNPMASKCQPRFEIPKEAYPPSMGYCTSGLPDCWGRPDGYHPDEKGRCHVFFECKANRFKQWQVCPEGHYFNPKSRRCHDKYAIPQGAYSTISRRRSGSSPKANQLPSTGPKGDVVGDLATRCETAPSCAAKPDGNYAHLERKCEWYFTCRNQSFLGFTRCGGFMQQPVFNEQTGRCENLYDVPAPCGKFKEESACAMRNDGMYPARHLGCSSYFTCARGAFQGYEVCPGMQVFNRQKLRCADAEKTQPPCGTFTASFGPTN